MAKRNRCKEWFFEDADKAIEFHQSINSLNSLESGRKNLSLKWRYRWPDALRDEVLARLLALNAERYAEEVAQGLHGKAGKKPATDPAAGGKHRGRPAKAAESADTGQIGLAL